MEKTILNKSVPFLILNKSVPFLVPFLGNKNMNQFLFSNGQVITMEREGLTYPACAVVDNKILAVGEADYLKSLLGGDLQEVDMDGGVLLPGFVDCHLHFVPACFLKMNLDIIGVGVKSVKELLSILKEKVNTVAADKWIMGLRMNEDDFAEKRFPLLQELDDAAPNNPLLLMRYDGHSLMANSLAMEKAGIDDQTQSPPGGEIERKDGILTGVMKEKAMGKVMRVMPTPETEDFMQGSRLMTRALLSEGVTGFHNVLMTREGDLSGALGSFEIPLYKMFAEEIPFRHYPLISAPSVERTVALLEQEFSGKKIDGVWRGGAWKLFADGTFGSRTAYFNEEYNDLPGEFGYMVVELDELREQIFAAQDEGLRVVIHAIGDKAVEEVAQIFLNAALKYGHKPLYHRIEHCSMIQPRTVKVLKNAGIVCSMQPSFIVSEGSWIRDRVGDRVNMVYPMRTLMDQGIRMCGGSDTPVEVSEPLKGIWGAVVREGFTGDQSLSPYEAISLYTSQAAAASFEEDTKGTITPGKLADLVVLDKNPLSVPPEEIQYLKVKLTMIDGKIHFQG